MFAKVFGFFFAATVELIVEILWFQPLNSQYFLISVVSSLIKIKHLQTPAYILENKDQYASPFSEL